MEYVLGHRSTSGRKDKANYVITSYLPLDARTVEQMMAVPPR